MEETVSSVLAPSDLSLPRAVVHDASSAQSDQDALRESESRFRTLAECVPVVVWMTDSDNRCTYVSAYWGEITGRDPGQDVGFQWVDALHPDDRGPTVANLVAASKLSKPFQGEFRVKRADGQYGWLSYHGVPFFRADGAFAGYIGTCIDITEHKQRERTGYRIQDNLLLGQEAERKRFARDLHDDIGQRLVLLAMAIREIKALVPSASPVLEAKVQNIQDEVARITTDLRRLSHNLHPSTVVHLGLLPALRQLCREFSEQTSIVVEFVGSATCAHMSEEGALALFRVGQECLANVAKHSRSREAKVSLTERSGEIRLAITDRGVGFDVAKLQASSGLGFVSIHERARMLGANVKIQSAVSRGTRVELRLPPPNLRSSRPEN